MRIREVCARAGIVAESLEHAFPRCTLALGVTRLYLSEDESAWLDVSSWLVGGICGLYAVGTSTAAAPSATWATWAPSAPLVCAIDAHADTVARLFPALDVAAARAFLVANSGAIIRTVESNTFQEIHPLETLEMALAQITAMVNEELCSDCDSAGGECA